jgi:hypothetical protein
MPKVDEDGFLEGRIHNWITDRRNHHALLFTAIHELNRECHRFVDGRAVDKGSALHKTIAVLFARLMELFQGVFITVERGMMSVSRIIFRAHLEAYFCLRAIDRDPTFLKQYLDQLHIHRKRLVNRIRKSAAPGLSSLKETLDENLALEIDKTIEEHQICPLTTEDAARRAGLHGVYATAYAALSGAVHTTAWDLESHLDYDDKEQAIKGFRYGPSDSDSKKLLALAGMQMADALGTVSSIFGEDRKQLCATFKNQFQEVLGLSD